jgi:acyl carrier protein
MSHAVDLEDLRVVLAEIIEVEPEQVGEDLPLVEALGMDSLTALEVVVVMEKRYGVSFSEDDMRAVTTLRSAYELLLGKTAAVRA